MFDFDSTLGAPKMCVKNCRQSSGQTAKCTCPGAIWGGYREWLPTFASIPSVFADLTNKGYKIVILSNQSGLGRNRGSDPSLSGRDKTYKSITAKRQDYLDKIQELVIWCNKAQNVPITLTAVGLIGKGVQKPSPAGFESYNKMMNENKRIDCDCDSFYCGDAAGRSKGDLTNLWQDGADTFDGGESIVASDQIFAVNLGVQFKTPEEVFAVGHHPPQIFAGPPSPRKATGFRYSACDWSAKGYCDGDGSNTGWCSSTGPYNGPYQGV